jgi:hypothetical protein
MSQLLANEAHRPTASQLLELPVVKLYRYLLYDEESYLASIAKDPAASISYISGMTLLNKSKAIVCMLGLMNLYGSAAESVAECVEQTEGYIPMIELLTICLKERDNDFLRLYEHGLRLLAGILSKANNPEVKTKCKVAGLVALVITAIEKESLR